MLCGSGRVGNSTLSRAYTPSRDRKSGIPHGHGHAERRGQHHNPLTAPDQRHHMVHRVSRAAGASVSAADSACPQSGATNVTLSQSRRNGRVRQQLFQYFARRSATPFRSATGPSDRPGRRLPTPLRSARTRLTRPTSSCPRRRRAAADSVGPDDSSAS